MKDGIKEIVGRTVAGVVIAYNKARPPHHQIFLIFEDGTSFEIYGDSFSCTSGVNRGGMEWALRYARLAPGAQVTNVYLGNGSSSGKMMTEFGQPDTGKYLH